MRLPLMAQVLLLTACASFHCSAQAPVWKVSKDGNHFYLGGTFHLLSSSDYPLPTAFDQAYQAASSVVLETDLDGSRDSKYQTQLLRQLMYPAGETLRQKLSPETYARLDNFFAERGVPTAQIIRFKAGMTVMTLTLLELRRNGLAEEGVDTFYMKKAKADNKELGKLEELQQQMAFISSMGAGQEDEIIRQALDDLEQIPQQIRDMKVAWRQGDNQSLEQLGIEEWQSDYPNVYQQLLVDRNNNWMASLTEFNRDEDVELVLVGALHLVGQDGLLAKLRAQGHDLQQLP